MGRDPQLEVGTRTLVSFRDGVTLDRVDGAIVLEHPWGRLRLRGLAREALELLLVLETRDVDADALGDVPQVDDLLPRLEPLLCRTVASDGRVLATAVPMAPDAALREVISVEDARLSRFAYLRRDGELLLESPLAKHRVVLHDGAAAAVACGAHADGLPADAVDAVLGLLVATGVAVVEDEVDPVHELWSFHDLVFHARSRLGRHDHPFGGLYRHADRQPPLPAVAPPRPYPLVELPRPDWDEVVARDPSLTEAIESRRSIRAYDDSPVTLAQLGELLYRTARVRGVVDASETIPYDVVDRPFPTGGGSGELELYLTVARCDGLDPGVYHYDAAAHGLRALPTSDRDRRALLAAAWRAAAERVDPQVLITITARFGRVSWKYDSIAYALTLKHVGVLYQTLYLVATAMGLAPCGLGSGDADVAARAFGLDWAAESSVGEFLIGSRPGSRAGAATRRRGWDSNPRAW